MKENVSDFLMIYCYGAEGMYFARIFCKYICDYFSILPVTT